MTVEEFDLFWRTNYPRTSPLPHLFKLDYKARWLRINSLENSKNRPANNSDWITLLERQNKVITDLVGNKSLIYGITGEYNFGKNPDTPEFLTVKELKDFKFTALKAVDMKKVSWEEYRVGQTYLPYLTEFIWEKHSFDPLLKAIAVDDMRMFFVSVTKKCLIAPFDGGIDIIVDTPHLKNYFKTKYKNWLSDF